jgi:hypothetical protein
LWWLFTLYFSGMWHHIVLYVDNTFSEKHTASTSWWKCAGLKWVWLQNNVVPYTHGRVSGDREWELGQFNFPPVCVWGGNILWSRKGLFSCSPFLLTRPSSIVSPLLVGLSDHPAYINQSILHPVFFNPDEASSIFLSNAGLHLHDMTTVSQPRKPQPEHIFIPSTLL